jgi:hypothetical protein
LKENSCWFNDSQSKSLKNNQIKEKSNVRFYPLPTQSGRRMEWQESNDLMNQCGVAMNQRQDSIRGLRQNLTRWVHRSINGKHSKWFKCNFQNTQCNGRYANAKNIPVANSWVRMWLVMCL